MRKAILAAVAATAMISTAAAAAVIFDEASGTGFVGKGDVQLAFGWNNAKLQSNAGGVTFTFDDIATYEATCTFVTGEGTRGEKTHNIDLSRHSSIVSAIQLDARTHKQIDGFILTGFGTQTVSGSVPVIGETCVGENDEGVAQNGTWTAVELVSSGGGALYVNYGGKSVLLPETPTV